MTTSRFNWKFIILIEYFIYIVNQALLMFIDLVMDEIIGNKVRIVLCIKEGKSMLYIRVRCIIYIFLASHFNPRKM